jgi:ornithine cyclodeaminase/alanine dehydrogenase-like protein (mu-crystallin family)
MEASLVLARADVARLLSVDACIEAIERAFVAHGEGRTLPPAILGVPAGEGGFHIKAAGVTLGRRYFAAKVNGNFAQNPQRGGGLPAIQGVIVLADADTGSPLAILDSIEITALRTAATSALAAKHLARPTASVATVVGCGVQGRYHVRALARVLALERVWLHDMVPDRARALGDDLTAELGLPVMATTDLHAAVRGSDVCVTCTPAQSPVLGPADVPPGLFLAAIGADREDKQELEPEVLASAAVVVDHLEQCATIGELHHALARGLMDRAAVRAELWEVVAGRRVGRLSDDEVVVFDSSGTALQDVAAAAAVYERAVESRSGLMVDLGMAGHSASESHPARDKGEGSHG